MASCGRSSDTTKVLNPKTKRYVTVGKKVYNELVRNEYIHDKTTNTLMVRQTNRIVGAGNILDEDVPDIGVNPIQPTKYEAVKNKVVSFVTKNANRVAEWILNVAPKSLTKMLPLKLLSLILFSKCEKYKPVQRSKISNRAFKNDAVEYSLQVVNNQDPLKQMNELDVEIKRLLEDSLKKFNGLKFYICLKGVSFYRKSANGAEYN